MKTLTVEKPWGRFEQFTLNEKTTVKIISVKRNSSLSLQYHENRSEFWKIILGHPIVMIGDRKILAKPGDEFEIEKKEKHQVEAVDDDVEFLEIAYGDFDENDIVRLKDKYGRA